MLVGARLRQAGIDVLRLVEKGGDFGGTWNVEFLESCTPGCYNNEGRPAERSARDSFYGAGSPAFIRVLEEWRARGDLAGLELS